MNFDDTLLAAIFDKPYKVRRDQWVELRPLTKRETQMQIARQARKSSCNPIIVRLRKK